ncbi:MAG: hypothetical protein GEU26_10960 [Nitrososphaeraceae archaeon]|nr:hypothetical protein [Nitrososphaeraceae archaeon]
MNTTSLIDRLKVEDEKLNVELEESHGDCEKMKAVFEKRIDLYKQTLKEESLTELDRLRLENKKEWTLNHLLNLIIEKELRDKITSLTKRVYKLEKAVELGEGA